MIEQIILGYVIIKICDDFDIDRLLLYPLEYKNIKKKKQENHNIKTKLENYLNKKIDSFYDLEDSINEKKYAAIIGDERIIIDKEKTKIND